MFDTPVFALTAAGGNSRAARSMRARLQWRDRFGRWIEMGRGVKFKVRGADGSARSVIGSFVGAVDDKTGQVYVSRDPNGLPDGFYDVKSSNAQEFVANLDESQLAERGIELGKDASGNDVGQRVAEDIPNITEMKVKGAPEGWIAQKGTFGGKKVIETDDGDFRVHFAGKDDTVLLEDHRANPGQAEQQRSMAEAFKKVSDVDIQREESGDAAYTGLADDNDEKLASRSRDEKIDQIKGNERTLANDRANLGAKQAAMTANETLKKELADEGQPYDPEGADSDEAHEARKAAPAPDATAETPAPQASTGAIDTTTFDVAPEGFLVPTGKRTNDISPEGLANFMTAEKEQLGKGGARLVVDTDNGTAEIHNSADTLDNAKAQAGGLGTDHVLDLAGGTEVRTADEVVDPNSPDVNPNLNGDTSPEAPNAEDRNPDAVEPGRADTGTDAPASDQPNPEDGRGADAPDAGGSAGPDDSGADSSPSSAPGSVEELQARRAKVQAALDNAGDPKDIIALNEQADALDTRISAKSSAPERPNAGDIGNRMTENERSREEALRLLNESEGDPLALSDEDYKRLEALATEQERKQDVLENTLERLQSDVIPSLERDYENLRAQLDEANGVQELDFDADRSAPESSGSPEAPEGDIAARQAELAEKIEDLERQQTDAERRLNANTVEGDDDALQAEVDRLFDELADVQNQYLDLESRINGAEVDREQVDMAEADLREIDETAVAEGRANREKISGPWAENPLKPIRSEIDAAPEGAIIAEEHNESGDQRLYRKREDGKWEQLKRDGSGEPSGYVTRGDQFETQGSRSHYVSDMDGTRPVDPEIQRRREAQAARTAEPTPAAEPYSEPGDTEAAAAARAELDAIDAEIESELTAAESAPDAQVEAEHLSRVRTLERQRKIQENALNRALGNAPMDLNGELGWSMRDPENRGSLPETPEAPEAPAVPEDAPEAPEDVPAALDPDLTPEENPSISLDEAIAALPEDNRTPEERLVDAETEVAAAERNYVDVLSQPDYSEEEYERALDRRDYARALRDELIEARDYEDAGQMEEREMNAQAQADYGDDFGWSQVAGEVEENLDILASEESGRPGGALERADDPDRTSEGYDNRVEAAKAKLQGKDLSDDERSGLTELLSSDSLSDNQLSRIENEIDAKPNRANTTTVARPETEQPGYYSSADQDIVNAEREDPNFVFDEDLTWRKINEEFPDAVLLDNGDLIIETTTKTTGSGRTLATKKYDVTIRRTNKNRFMVYILETDQHGVRRAKRIGNTEWHSYEALEKRITRGRKLANGSRPSSFFAKNKETPTENLGVQAFPEDDFLGDIGNPDAPVPTTGDERYDHLLEVVAGHIRNGDADIEGIEEHLERIDPGSGAIDAIMKAVIGRAQDDYRPSTNPWQLYDGETAEIGMHVDWTNWHEQLNWWRPDGTLNEDRIPNPNYGKVRRGIIKGYIKENSDGKGHTYGDHVQVQWLDNNGRPTGNWAKVSAQTLRLTDADSERGLPFFSKREEWRTDPEALARRFRVPNASTEEPVQTKERPRRDLPQSRRLRFTANGSLSGYSNVTVPVDQKAIIEKISSGEVHPQIRPASEARPGMMIARMDNDGNQFVDSIIRVENVGDGAYRIHAARPDGNGSADVDSFVVPGNADIAIWTAPEIPGPKASQPGPGTTGEVVEFERDGETVTGVVAFDDGDGNLTVSTSENRVVDVPKAEVRKPKPGEYPSVEFLDSEIAKVNADLLRMGNGRDSFMSARVSQDKKRTLESMKEMANNDWKVETSVLVFDGKVASVETRDGQYGPYYVLTDEATAAFGKRFFSPSKARNAEERDAAKGFTYDYVMAPVKIGPNGINYTVDDKALLGQEISVLKSNIEPSTAEDGDRPELLAMVDSLSIPPALRDLIRRWALNPDVSAAELSQIMSIVKGFNSMSPIEQLVDQILDRMGVSLQERADLFL